MKFLVCTDGSPRSRDTMPHVARLASATAAEVILARVLDPRVDAAGVVSPHLEWAVQQVEASWKRQLEAQLAKSGVAGRVLVARREWGKEISDAITKAAGTEGADLIAIGSRGSGVLRHVLLGSVAMGVISRSPVPVLATGPRNARPKVWREGYHLAVTSDGSADARSVFEGIFPLLTGGSIEVTLVQVTTPQAGEMDAAAKRRATEELAGLSGRLPKGVNVKIEVRVAPPGAGTDTAILATVHDIRADAIAMATHGHSALRHLVAGSTALGVLANSELPVILVKSHPSDPDPGTPDGH